MAVTVNSLQAVLDIRAATKASPVLHPGNELFRFRFGTDASVAAGTNIFRLHIDPIGIRPPDEIWVTNSDVRIDAIGHFTIAECDDYLAAHVEIDLQGVTDFKELTTRVYDELLQLTQARGYPNLVRVWNYFPGINAGKGDLELYRQFTAGRAVAYGAFAHEGEVLPAATAIGTRDGTPLTITAIAARSRCRTIENPRQTSAYEYPREYGPISPSFSRAVVVASPSGHRILISGTASIVGHRSLHPDDPMLQTTETLRNLEDLIRYARSKFQTRDSETQFLTHGNLRVYIRRPEHLEKIRRTLREALGGDLSIVFLQGDICRRELLLEIEAACDI